MIGCMLVCLSSASCDSSLLDISNENTISSGNYWKTESDVDSGLVAVYAMFYRQGTWTRNIYTQLNGMADDGVSYAGWTELQEWAKFKFTNYDFSETNTKIYREHYVAISRACQVLDHIDDVTFSSEEKKKDVKAQAEFLRAFYYYYLAVMYENVPIVLKTPSAGDNPEQGDLDAILTIVENDLKDASENLPTTRDESNKARPTKGAALALLAKAYMQHHKWAEAKTCLEWLVDGPGKDIYDLVADYGDNFSNKTEDNKESVYEIHFSLVNKVGFDQTDNYLDPNAELGTQIEMNQGPAGIGWDNIEACRWLVDYYKREKTTDGQNDHRLFYTLWYDQEQQDFPEFPNQTIYQKPWNSDWGSRCFIKKYSTDAYPLYYWNDNNFRSIRYADVLLMYAEVLNELSATPPAEAVALVNRVRNRSHLPDLQSSTYYDGSKIIADKAAFREHLKIERALELPLECVRWADLKRWGIDDDKTLNELKSRDADFDNFVIGKSIRMPLPQSEVDNNPNLVQNPNY
jgi:hypothetical protein